MFATQLGGVDERSLPVDHKLLVNPTFGTLALYLGGGCLAVSCSPATAVLQAGGAVA